MITQQITPKIITPNGYIKCGFEEHGNKKKSPSKQVTVNIHKYDGFSINKKLRRGITCLLRAGANNNSEVYRILKARGFLNRDGTDTLFSQSYCEQCTRFLRKKYGIPVKQKREHIFQLHREGKNIDEIRVSANTTNDYIKEVAQYYGFKVRVPQKPKKYRAKRTAQHDWSIRYGIA